MEALRWYTLSLADLEEAVRNCGSKEADQYGEAIAAVVTTRLTDGDPLRKKLLAHLNSFKLNRPRQGRGRTKSHG